MQISKKSRGFLDSSIYPEESSARSNYDIGEKLKREIRSNGINMEEAKYSLKKHIDK